jgi:hypothetical protein
MKILIKEEQLKLIEQTQKANPNILVKPNNWSKVKAFTYKNKPVTLYYDNKTGEFHLNDIGTKNTRQLPKSEYGDVGSELKPMSTNYLMKWKKDFELTNRLNGNDNSKLNAEKVLDKNPYEKNPNASKTSNPVKPNPVSAVKPKPVSAVKSNQVGIRGSGENILNFPSIPTNNLLNSLIYLHAVTCVLDADSCIAISLTNENFSQIAILVSCTTCSITNMTNSLHSI